MLLETFNYIHILIWSVWKTYPDQVKYTVVENPTVNAFINIYSDVEIDEYIDEDLDNEA